MIETASTLYSINGKTILRLPARASAHLPSRGQIMVGGNLNGYQFRLPLEPDGKGSHWLGLDSDLLKGANVSAGDTVKLAIEPTKDWIEPEIPADLKKAVSDDAEATAIWHDITPMARWEWVRWTRSTSNPETRARRVEVAISKMKSGKRRPCCWNRNLSTDPSVSKSGVLLVPPAE